jgi:hypothetical protein
MTSPAKQIRAANASLVPGVILQPEEDRQPQHLIVMQSGRPRPAFLEVDHRLTIPFTGEYQMFPTSSARLHHDWALERGTLLENEYATAGAGSLETEASQPLVPPIDLMNCGKVQLVLVNDENGPFGTTMQLIADAGSVDLGTEVGGLDRRTEETLEFTVPQGTTLRVKTIRIAFHRIPLQGRNSMRVVVKRFTLLPRGRN